QPNDPASHSFYARWLSDHGRTGEAIPHLVQAIALSPADLSSRYSLMGAYAKTGQTAELKALASETLALLPADAQPARYLSDPATPKKEEKEGWRPNAIPRVNRTWPAASWMRHPTRRPRRAAGDDGRSSRSCSCSWCIRRPDGC